jgi:hypothetical protein
MLSLDGGSRSRIEPKPLALGECLNLRRRAKVKIKEFDGKLYQLSDDHRPSERADKWSADGAACELDQPTFVCALRF